MDKAKVVQNWNDRGFNCDVWTDPPGKVWKEEVHEVDQLVMLIEGEMEVKVPGRIHRPKVGEEVLVPAGTPHTVKNPGKTPNRWFYGYKNT